MDQPLVRLVIGLLILIGACVLGRWIWLLLKRRAMRLADQPVPYRQFFIFYGTATLLFIATPPLLDNSAATFISDWRLRYSLSDDFQLGEMVIYLFFVAYFMARVHFQKRYLQKPTPLTDPVRFTLPGVLYLVGMLGIIWWLVTSPILVMDPLTSEGFLIDTLTLIGVVVGAAGAYISLGFLLTRLGVDLGSMGGRPRQAATPPAVAGPLDRE